MSDLTKEQCHQFWTHGYALSNAPLTFAAPEKRQAYEAAKSVSAIEALEAGAEQFQASERPGAEALTALFAEPQRILVERSRLETSLRSNVISWCESGAIRAFGYESPRKLEHAPIELPRSVWKGRVHWGQSTLEVAGMEFVEVRLLSASMIEQVEAKYRSTNRPTGRPSIEEHLKTCIEEMIQQGSIDSSRSMRSQYDIIKAQYKSYANAHKLKKDSVGNEAIRKVLSPIYNRLQDSKKL